MLISLKKNIAYLAMTKTASTSIEAALTPYCDIAYYKNPRVKHISYRRYKKFVVPYIESLGFKDIETTCLIREPISWLSSWYRFRSRDEVIGQPESTENLSFDEFAMLYMDKDSDLPRFGSQSRFMSGFNGTPAIDYVFRYENLPVFADFLNTRFHRKFEFAHLNPSPTRTASLSPNVKKQLEEYLAPEYEIYESALG